MRILFANGYPVWANSLPWGFRQLNHPVEILPLIEQKSLNQTMRNFKPDVVLTAGWISEYTPAKIALLKKTARQYGCLQAYWATEDINHLRKWSIPLVKKLQPDVVFTINAACISAYREFRNPSLSSGFGLIRDVLRARCRTGCMFPMRSLNAQLLSQPGGTSLNSDRCLNTALSFAGKDYDVPCTERTWESVLFQEYTPLR